MLDSNALTKIQTAILASVIIIAAIGGAIAFALLRGQEQAENIKIGVLADLYATGKDFWQGVVLAAEEINAEGGLLGRQVEVIGEDREDGRDGSLVSNALTRLITFHEVDFLILHVPPGENGFACQDIIAEHKKIGIAVSGNLDEFTKRVIDDYDKYKYFFRVQFNATSQFQGITDSLLLCREITGFDKIGYMGPDLSWSTILMSGLDSFLPDNGLEPVYRGVYPARTFDFSSYFAAAEAAGTEVLVSLISGDEAIPFVKEYYDRQSPMLIYGGILGEVGSLQAWEWTDGKCNNMAISAAPIVAGYPLTSKTLPAREAYLDRWGEEITWGGGRAYDALRFILADAIRRAGTIETEAVIRALEVTSIETTQAKNFVFTTSHDVMMGQNPNNPNADYTLVAVFQWQDGKLVPVYPKELMEEAGTTLTFPEWSGPWD